MLAGVLNCGVNPILSGSLATEFGDSYNAQGSMSGIINGRWSYLEATYRPKPTMLNIHDMT